jgi:hypothetical protein
MHSLGVDLTLCQWMAIVAVSLIPLTWLGTPKDFWSVKVINLTCISKTPKDFWSVKTINLTLSW